jgi:transcriptional regulator with XRE-family HTH domain
MYSAILMGNTRKVTMKPAELREMYGEDPQRILGVRLRALREEAGMTQAQLAERMTRLGFPMHQTTVAKIEANQRPVTVNEAVLLASVVGFTLQDLLADPAADKETAALREELRQATARRLELEAVRTELQAQRARIDTSLLAATTEWAAAGEAERDIRQRYRLALRRSAGHSPAEDEASG